MRMHFRLLGLFSSLLLAACGGGGGGSAADTAEGLWLGSTDSGRSVIAAVLDDGEFWFIYSGPFSETPAGIVQGPSIAADGVFTASGASPVSFDGFPISEGAFNGNYSGHRTFDGTTSSNTGVTVFNLDYLGFYDRNPSLASIAGSYTAVSNSSGGADNDTVVIAPNGLLTLSGASGCQATGTVTPRSTGSVYNVSLTFGGGNCVNGTTIVSGITVSDSGDLVIAGLDATQTVGYVFDGTKQ